MKDAGYSGPTIIVAQIIDLLSGEGDRESLPV
jgi:hypothetical protein